MAGLTISGDFIPTVLMKHFIILLILLLFSLVSFSQKLKNIKGISLGTKFKLKLIERDSGRFAYKIISEIPFEKEFDSNTARKLLDDTLKSNEVQGIFGIGKFGDSKKVLLLIKSGYKEQLDYDLFIDVKGKGRYKETSTLPLGVEYPSVEMWPYYIYSIKIKSFQLIGN